MPRIKQNEPEVLYATVRANIEYELKMKGWNKKHLVELTHISHPVVYHRLRDNTCDFRLKELVIIADKLGVTVDKLCRKREEWGVKTG